LIGSPPAGWPGRVAVGIVRGEPPTILLAESEPVLGRLLATRLVASAPPEMLSDAGVLDAVRAALLAQQWAECISLWMQATGEVFDGYPDEEVVTEEDLNVTAPLDQISELPIFKSRS
jgi:hypothetical protein